MKTFAITSKISINVEETNSATFDKEADFGQIVLRVRNGDKYVNFRVTGFGETVTLEFYRGDKFSHDICLRNEPLRGYALQTLMDRLLA